MTQLYINDKYCLSVEQLKGYFTEDLTADSVIYYDILDYGRYGDISQWLQELGEDELSAKVASIDNTLSDSEYFIELKKIITGDSEPTPFDSLKPSFEKCFQYEGYEEEPNGSTEIVVSIKFKILMSVNESYELKVSSSWGTRGQQINPSDYIEGEAIKISFSFRKRPGKEWEINDIRAEGTELEVKQIKKEQSQSFIETINGVSFKMIKVEGGTFIMGAQSTDPNGENYDSEAYDEEKPVHSVTLDDYYIGETEVSQELWEAVMGTNPSWFKGSYKPVEMVSWEECQEFIAKLNQLTGKRFRLPTEAEWEYAARGGNKSRGYKYAGSNTIGDVAWYDANACVGVGKNSPDYGTHPVGTKSPNELGLYDMSGNVWEWCSDWYGWYGGYTSLSSSQTNPTGPTSNRYSSRVSRGGSWSSYARGSRVAFRHGNTPGYSGNYLGLRLVMP